MTFILALLAAGTISAAEDQMPYLQLVTTDIETYSLDIQSLQIRRFASGETMYEAWVRTDYNKKAYLENMELIKGSTAPQEYAAKLSHSMARIIFSPRGRLAYLEHISYGYDGEVLNSWREEEADWRDVVPETPGAVMLVKISEYASQEYDGAQPERVLMNFLTWYVEGRLHSDRDRGVSDPLMSYAYMDRDDLTDNFKQHISAEMPRPGADPVLETQWIKELMAVGAVLIRGDWAQVSVYDYRFKVLFDQQTPLLYFLRRQDGRWRIDSVERESRKLTEIIFAGGVHGRFNRRIIKT